MYTKVELLFPGDSAVRNLPAKQEVRVPSLGQEVPLKKEVATHSSIFCLGSPMDRRAWCYSQQGCKELGTTSWLKKTTKHKFPL